MCQCPLTGYLHFYFIIDIGNLSCPLKCQCPLTGYLHFYKTPFTKKGLCAVCQCPLTGYLHFYPCPSGAPCLQGFEGYVFPKFFENVTKVLHFAIFLFLQNFTTAHIKTLYSIITNFWQISSYFFILYIKKPLYNIDYRIY